jgi:hypothetical protein
LEIALLGYVGFDDWYGPVVLVDDGAVSEDLDVNAELLEDFSLEGDSFVLVFVDATTRKAPLIYGIGGVLEE